MYGPLLGKAIGIALFAFVFWVVGRIFSFFSKQKDSNNDITGWYNEKEDKYLCSDCFDEVQTLNKEDYERIGEEDLDSQDCTCSICGAELGSGKNNKVEEKKDRDKEEKVESKDEEKEFGPFLTIIVVVMIIGVIIGLFHPIGLLIAILAVLVAFIRGFLKGDIEVKEADSEEENVSEGEKGNEESDTEEEDLQAESQDLNKESSSNNHSSKYMIIFLLVTALVFGVISIIVIESGSSEEPAPNKEQSPGSPQKKLITLGGKPKIKDNIRWEITDVVNEGDYWKSGSTNGKFLKINLQAENLSADLKTVDINNDGKLIKSSQISYDCFYCPLTGTDYFQMQIELETGRGRSDLKPNIPESFYYTFEVPKNLEDFTIEFSYSLED